MTPMPTPLNRIGSGLTEAQVATYWEQGYLFPLQVFSAQRAQALRAELEQVEATPLGETRSVKSYKRVNAHAVMPFAYDLAADPAILDLIEGIIGPDILVYGVEFFIKEPHTRHFVSLHQDLTYWGLGETQKMVTAWLALSPATLASGCMEFVAGSHKQAILPHEDSVNELNLLSRGQEVRADVAPEDRIPILLQPGEMSLHHGMTIHGSGPNQSDDRRIGVVIRYMSTDVRPESGLPDYAVLVRGEDKFNHFVNIPRPESLFNPTALERYEQIRKAQADVKMAGAGRRLQDSFSEA